MIIHEMAGVKYKDCMQTWAAGGMPGPQHLSGLLVHSPMCFR
jgi:hypothetical protein